MDRIKIGHLKINPWKLSHFLSRETGVGMTIWVTESQCISTPFIIVTPGYKSFSRHGIIISIDEPPEVLYPEGKTVEPSVWCQIVSWIRLNRRILLQVWNGQISTYGFCQNLMEI